MSSKKIINLQSVLIYLFIGLTILVFSLLGFFSSIQGFFLNIQQDFFTSSRKFFTNLENFSFALNNIDKINQENADLKSKIQNLESDNSNLKKSITDLSFIYERDLIDFDPEYDVIPARIIFINQSNLRQFVINRGQRDNIETDDIVVLGNQVVGIITKSFTNYSEAILVGSEGYEINVISADNKTRGIARLNINGEIEIDEILNSQKVDEGEMFLTEGKDRKYPYGLLVGSVKRIIGSPADPTKKVFLQNIIDIKTLDRVYVMNYL